MSCVLFLRLGQSADDGSTYKVEEENKAWHTVIEKSHAETRARYPESARLDDDEIKDLCEGIESGLKIFGRCQFHLHFTCAFFVQKCFAQLFSTYILALKFSGKRISAQKLVVKCWWNWLQAIQRREGESEEVHSKRVMGADAGYKLMSKQFHVKKSAAPNKSYKAGSRSTLQHQEMMSD